MKKNTPVTKKKLTEHMGGALRTARLEAELPQADVAERVGVATEVYGRMERGLLTPSVPSLRKLCVVLRLDANAVLGLGTRGAAWPARSCCIPADASPPRTRARTARSALEVGVRYVQQLAQQGQPLRRPAVQDVDDAAQLRLLSSPRLRNRCRSCPSLATQGQERL